MFFRFLKVLKYRSNSKALFTYITFKLQTQVSKPTKILFEQINLNYDTNKLIINNLNINNIKILGTYLTLHFISNDFYNNSVFYNNLSGFRNGAKLDHLTIHS